MSRAVIFMVGATLGVALAFRLRRTTEGRCCERVAKAVRDRVGEACGPLCQSLGDSIGVWGHSPDLLDVFGVK